MSSHDRDSGIAGLSGQVCLVTGASQGIGLATVRELLRWGARVALGSRSLDRAERAAGALDEHSGAVLPCELDVADPTSIESCLEHVRNAFGPVEVLVNNAGLPVIDELWNKPLHDFSLDELTKEFRRVSAVDLAGARAMTRAVLPDMMEAKAGSIVFISSTPALSGHHATPYTEAKAALLGLMRDVALNYAPHGIRANAIAPGNIKTSWFDQLSEERREELRQEAPLRRWGSPDEVARAIAFFASPQSSFITAQTLVIDGGKVVH